MVKNLVQQRFLRPIVGLLRQGVTPEKIALSLVSGVALGVFPLLGSTTLLCTMAAIFLRVNLPAIQLVNYVVYPLQIALLIPFFRLGEKLFRAAPLAMSAPQLYAMLRTNLWHTTIALWTATWHGIVAWCLLAPVFVGTVYPIVRWLLRRVWREELPRGAQSE